MVKKEWIGLSKEKEESPEFLWLEKVKGEEEKVFLPVESMRLGGESKKYEHRVHYWIIEKDSIIKELIEVQWSKDMKLK